jgi:chemotaxis regulatin CheY-phosphate phosphatase CheZ
VNKEKLTLQIDQIQNSASEIIFAFQFQDITTQQLEHVHRILEAIHTKFMNLMKSFTTLRSSSQLGQDVFGAIDNVLHEKLDAENRKYFEEKTRDIMRQNAISQDDIDQFFKK